MYTVNELLKILDDPSYAKDVGVPDFIGKEHLRIRNQFELNAFIAMHYDLCVQKDATMIKFFLPVGEEDTVYVLYNNDHGRKFSGYHLCKAVQNLSLKLQMNPQQASIPKPTIDGVLKWVKGYKGELEEYYSYAIEGAAKETLAHTRGCMETLDLVLTKLNELT